MRVERSITQLALLGIAEDRIYYPGKQSEKQDYLLLLEGIVGMTVCVPGTHTVRICGGITYAKSFATVLANKYQRPCSVYEFDSSSAKLREFSLEFMGCIAYRATPKSGQ